LETKISLTNSFEHWELSVRDTIGAVKICKAEGSSRRGKLNEILNWKKKEKKKIKNLLWVKSWQRSFPDESKTITLDGLFPP